MGDDRRRQAEQELEETGETCVEALLSDAYIAHAFISGLHLVKFG